MLDSKRDGAKIYVGKLGEAYFEEVCSAGLVHVHVGVRGVFRLNWVISGLAPF